MRFPVFMFVATLAFCLRPACPAQPAQPAPVESGFWRPPSARDTLQTRRFENASEQAIMATARQILEELCYTVHVNEETLGAISASRPYTHLAPMPKLNARFFVGYALFTAVNPVLMGISGIMALAEIAKRTPDERRNTEEHYVDHLYLTVSPGAGGTSWAVRIMILRGWAKGAGIDFDRTGQLLPYSVQHEEVFGPLAERLTSPLSP